MKNLDEKEEDKHYNKQQKLQDSVGEISYIGGNIENESIMFGHVDFTNDININKTAKYDKTPKYDKTEKYNKTEKYDKTDTNLIDKLSFVCEEFQQLYLMKESNEVFYFIYFRIVFMTIKHLMNLKSIKKTIIFHTYLIIYLT